MCEYNIVIILIWNFVLKKIVKLKYWNKNLNFIINKLEFFVHNK